MHLAADRISHSYGGLSVLDDISFRAGDGEIAAVVGPSGSGKSTLLRILGGLEQPSSGQALMGGARPAACLNPITYVFQDFALLPWRSVEGNIALGLEPHGLSAAARQAAIADVLARTGLADFAKAYPRQLSGGMRQRAGIARALAVHPAILLLDEPLSALDAQTRELLLDDLVQLSLTEKFTGVYVTHNLNEAVRIGTRIIVLSRRPGRIRAIVEVPVPLAERRRAAPELARLEDQLWQMLRDEARDAERETLHA